MTPATRKTLSALLAIVCVLAATCSSGDSDDSNSWQRGSSRSETQAARTAIGIAKVGGRLSPKPSCPGRPGVAPREVVKIAWVGPDLASFASIGMETLVLDKPSLIVEAYINEINKLGGINKTCFELVTYPWNLRDPNSSFQRICMDLPEQNPILLLGLEMNNATLRCATLGEQIPTFGIFTSVSDSSLAAAEGTLFLGDGSIEYLLANTLDVAVRAKTLTDGDHIGLLVTEGTGTKPESATAREASERLGLDVVELIAVPAEFGSIGVAIAERHVRLLEGDLTEAEFDAGIRNFLALPEEQAAVLQHIERFFLDAAKSMKDANVTAVVASADSIDVRRLMRAADQINWLPRWVINDSQPAVLTLTDAPRRQVRNLVQVSSKRAAGDSISDLDTGCISLRNTFTEALPFSHRVHTDAWNLITATCDHLDVVFEAITRTTGTPTRETLMDALSTIDYVTTQGSHMRFTHQDRNGANRFRVLQADPDCVLDYWGCMRSTTKWFTVEPANPTN